MTKPEPEWVFDLRKVIITSAEPELIEFIQSLLSHSQASLLEGLTKMVEGMKTYNDYLTSCICDQCGSEREEIVQNQTLSKILDELDKLKRG